MAGGYICAISLCFVVMCVFIPVRWKARVAEQPGTGQSTKSDPALRGPLAPRCEEEACRALARLPRASRLAAESSVSLVSRAKAAVDFNVVTA